MMCGTKPNIVNFLFGRVMCFLSSLRILPLLALLRRHIMHKFLIMLQKFLTLIMFAVMFPLH